MPPKTKVQLKAEIEPEESFRSFVRSQKPGSKLYERPRRVYELRWRSSEEWSRSLIVS